MRLIRLRNGDDSFLERYVTLATRRTGKLLQRLLQGEHASTLCLRARLTFSVRRESSCPFYLFRDGMERMFGLSAMTDPGYDLRFGGLASIGYYRCRPKSRQNTVNSLTIPTFMVECIARPLGNIGPWPAVPMIVITAGGGRGFRRRRLKHCPPQ